MSRVSVVIPAYNAERWIQEAVKSVQNQYHKDVEIIVVDDGSTDNTVKIVKGMDVGLVRLEKNSGECVASRIGFLHATGEYVCRLSADDTFISRNHLTEQVNVMDRSGADWCYNTISKSGVFVKDAKTIPSCLLPIPYKYYIKGLSRFDDLILKFPYVTLVLIMLRNPINSSSLMMRTDSYRKVLWSQDERTDCDFLLIANMLLKGFHGLAIHTPGVYYRTHDDQMTNQADYLTICKRHRGEIRKKVLDGSYPIWLKTVMRILGER